MIDAKLWARHDLFWKNRAAKYGDAYVGRIGENHTEQYQKIRSILEELVHGYYEKALDYGCGYGRFIPILSRHCGHIWAADILDKPLVRANMSAPNVTAVKCTAAGLPLPQAMNLIVVISVLHYVPDDVVFNEMTADLRKAAAPKCRFIIIDNAVDKDYHVKARSADALIKAVGLTQYKTDTVTVNKRQKDHWLIDGVKA